MSEAQQRYVAAVERHLSEARRAALAVLDAGGELGDAGLALSAALDRIDEAELCLLPVDFYEEAE